MEAEGYEIKREKYISCRATGQERFTRFKTLGVDYTEEAVTVRIAGAPRPSRQSKAALTGEKKQEYGQYQQIRTQAREMETIKRNVDSLLSAPDKSQRETAHERN